MSHRLWLLEMTQASFFGSLLGESEL